MQEIVMNNIEYIVRLVMAGLCGAIIGYERTSKHKEAGLKTHVIVAISSSLMMIISKYGFDDSVRFDASRIASQIVTGVGFLGAGIIFVRDKVTVSGLTTAAGIWGTAGVGMAAGSGLYTISFVASLLMLITNLFLKNTIATIRDQKMVVIEIVFDESHDEDDFDVEHFLDCNHLKLITLNTFNQDDKKKIQIKAYYFVDEFDNTKISLQLNEEKNISSYSFKFI